MLLLQTHLTYQAFLSVLLLSVFGEVVCDYAWPLPNGFPVGSRAILRGIPHVDQPHRPFRIEFLTYSPFDGSGDIDLRIAAHYGKGLIVFNNFKLDKGWQEEVIKRDSPIQAGKPFDITIVSEQSQFSVYINDSHFFDFPHRMPLHRIKYLHVFAGVTLSVITVDTIAVYSWPLPEGFPPNKKITIHGTPAKRNFDREFSINFQSCPSYSKECYIAFRMSVQYEKKIVVNNSYQKGVGWGQPQVYSHSPIKIDKPFIISIIKESNQFKVHINEQPFFTFNLREADSDIKYLALKDPVDVTSIALS